MTKTHVMIVSLLTFLSTLGLWGMSEAEIVQFADGLVQSYKDVAILIGAILSAIGIAVKDGE